MKNFILIIILLLQLSCSKEETNVLGPDGTTTNVATFTVLKSGKFNSSSGYPTTGTAQLILDSTSKYRVRLADDFSTSFSTGSVTIYLSKTMNLNLIDSSSFIRLAVINKNGMHQFKLEDKPADALGAVVVWCQPAGVKFGHADLK